VYDFPTVQVFVDHGIADYMATAPSGISVATLQSELNLDSHKITTILRHLSARGWVRETENGVFALNRSSRVLLQGHMGRSMIW
jgi:DNA-binding IclR family transcriptional regulator